MEEHNEEIVVLKYFDNAIDANIAKTKLDAYGIPCFLTEENITNLYPGQSLIAFKTRLHLFAADRERAIRILDEVEVSPDVDDELRCPRCQSTDVQRAFPRKIADSMLVNFFGIFMPGKKVHQCQHCGYEF